MRAHLLKSLYALVNILQVLVHCCNVQLLFAIFMSNAAVFFSLLFLFLVFALFTCVQVMYKLKTEMRRQCWVSQIVVAFIFAKTKLENTSIACNCIRWPNLVKYVNEPNPISIYHCAMYTKVEHAYSVCKTKNTQK